MSPEEKHAAQTAYLSMENVSDFYRQIILQGYLGELTQQITQEILPEIEPEIQPEIGLEPER
jgi:hypothetical protein